MFIKKNAVSVAASGYGMFPESMMGRRFAPSIVFESDNGTGAGGAGGGVPPAPAPAGGAGAPEDVTGLKNALESERKTAKTLAAQVRELQEQFKDIDPVKYKQLQAVQQQNEELNQREAKFRSELETEWTQKVTAEQNKTKDLMTQLNDLRMRTEAEKAYQASNGRSGAGDDNLSFFDVFYGNISRNLQLNDKGQIEVVDATGARLYSKKDATKLMSPAEYFASLTTHPVFGHFFAPQQPGRGGGMTPQNGTHRGGVTDMSGMSRAERLTALRSQTK